MIFSPSDDSRCENERFSYGQIGFPMVDEVSDPKVPLLKIVLLGGTFERYY